MSAEKPLKPLSAEELENYKLWHGRWDDALVEIDRLRSDVTHWQGIAQQRLEACVRGTAVTDRLRARNRKLVEAIEKELRKMLPTSNAAARLRAAIEEMDTAEIEELEALTGRKVT